MSSRGGGRETWAMILNRFNYKQMLLIGVLITASVLAMLLWLLPISGQVIVSPHSSASTTLWPQFVAAPAIPSGGDTVTVTVADVEPWAHVRLVVDGQTALLSNWEMQAASLGVTWVWTIQLPETVSPSIEVDLYSDCHRGCQLRGRTHLITQAPDLADAALSLDEQKETKLCTIFPNPERDWHGRMGWVVDLTYARWADHSEDRYWTVDQLAARTHQAQQKGLHVLVRVDFDKGQTLPPANDLLALDEYLNYLQRLARDERLQNVYGFIIGSGYNALDASSLAVGGPITSEWYARVFNGYGEPPERRDNVIQSIRQENPLVQVLVGPLRPWIGDQSGSIPYEIDAPWLSYMNTLVEHLAESATAKAGVGDVHALPNGFAISAPGRVSAPELAEAAQEPQTDLKRPEWDGAQAGFRVYQDFLAIINHSPTMQGLPVYISTTNTFTPDEEISPAQNYPVGWLSSALAEVNAQPQVRTLCWFLDFVPGDDQWDAFSLTRKPGRMQDASEEFELLLQSGVLE